MYKWINSTYRKIKIASRIKWYNDFDYITIQLKKTYIKLKTYVQLLCIQLKILFNVIQYQNIIALPSFHSSSALAAKLSKSPSPSNLACADSVCPVASAWPCSFSSSFSGGYRIVFHLIMSHFILFN